MRWSLRLERRDLLFMIEALMPDHSDKEHVADVIRSDEQLIDAMLDEDQLFQRLMAEEDALILVSPWLFFTVLLRRAQRDLAHEAFTVERRHLQRVLLFDVDRVVELLEQEPLRDYLATMLASFTRVESVTVPVRVRKGIWRRYRTSDLDVDGMVRYSQSLAEPFRFEPYRRIADVCLFLAGMFPEHIEAEYRYPLSQKLRPRARSRICVRLEDYEAHGRAFYQLAAEHARARVEGLDGVLAALSESFVLAEKPLAFLAKRYLQFTRYELFVSSQASSQ
jgi:hypothetical protein